MDFETWLDELAACLGRRFGDAEAGRLYVEQSGRECWRQMFDDDLSPDDAAGEECTSLAEMA